MRSFDLVKADFAARDARDTAAKMNSSMKKEEDITGLRNEKEHLRKQYNDLVGKYNHLRERSLDLQRVLKDVTTLAKQGEIKLNAEREKNKMLQDQINLLKQIQSVNPNTMMAMSGREPIPARKLKGRIEPVPPIVMTRVTEMPEK